MFGRLKQNHINAHYDYWPVLTALSLKYFDTVGIEVPEVMNWREFMRQFGWDGEIKRPSSSWGVGYERFVFDYNESIIAEMPDKTDIRKVKKMFFGQMRPDANHEVFYFPAIDLEKNLMFMSNSGNGESVELAPQGETIKCYPLIQVQKSDTPHLFKGSVHGIMTKQSRTNPSILAFILWEYDQIKAGKSEDDIRKEIYDIKSF